MDNLKGKLDKQLATKEKIQAKLEDEHEELENYKVSIEEEQEILRKQQATAAKAKQLAQDQLKELEQEAAQQQKQSQSDSGSSGSKEQAPASPKPSSGGGTFSYPVSGPITSGFGPRSCKGCSSFHHGLDFGVGIGTPIYASAPGVVSMVSSERDDSMNGYGNVVLVTHNIKGKTYTTLYAHLNSISVFEGQAVGKGQSIGQSGNTGNSTGPHLHFEIHNGYWKSKSGINPLSYLQ